MTYTERIAERRKTFKHICDGDDIRRRREDSTVQIRKIEKEEQLFRRRKLADSGSGSIGSVSIPTSCKNIHGLVESLFLHDPVLVLEASVALRKILSIDHKPPIVEVLEFPKVLSRMKELLLNNEYPEIQLEICWCLTNVASGTSEQTLEVVNNGFVLIFVEFLKCWNNEDLQEQAIWAIANIAGDRPEYRDMCISLGAVEALCAIAERCISNVSNVQLLRLSVWAISNMCRGVVNVHRAIPPVLSKLINTSNDTEVLADASWALSYLTTNTRGVLGIFSIDRLVTLLAHPSTTVHLPILRVIGNALCSDESGLVLSHSSLLLCQLKCLLNSNRKSIRKETLWAISNVCADSVENLQKVLNSGLMKLVAIMSSEMDVRREAVWSLCNASIIGTSSQIRQMVTEFALLETLCDHLRTTHGENESAVLDAIYSVLVSNEEYAYIFEECGGLSTIEQLLFHTNETPIQLACNRILDLINGETVGKENEPSHTGRSKYCTMVPPRSG